MSMRDEHPDLAALVDMLRSHGLEPRVTHIVAHDGTMLAGGHAPQEWIDEMTAWAQEPAPAKLVDATTLPAPYRGRRRA